MNKYWVQYSYDDQKYLGDNRYTPVTVSQSTFVATDDLEDWWNDFESESYLSGLQLTNVVKL
ncbi:conserved hypothetical protein [Vibrio phage 193E37-1]|nr:conserved hypothetical protein [Vibrio phage 193E37-1]